MQDNSLLKFLEQEAKAHREEDVILETIRSRDLAFEREGFKERARTIVARLHEAKSLGDMRSCRCYLSQGIYNRFRIELKLQRELQHQQAILWDFRILSFDIVRAHRAADYDCIDVRLEAQVQAVTLPAETAQDAAVVAAQKVPRTRITEYYSFMRHKDAKTLTKEIIDSCSRCGTLLAKEGEITKCKSCGALMSSGEFDWVLSAVTSKKQYQLGLKRVRSLEGQSFDRIEDRAAFIFWRYAFACATQEKQILHRDAVEEFLNATQFTTTLTEFAVNSINVERYRVSDSFSEVTVRVNWAARRGNKIIKHKESIMTLALEVGKNVSTGLAEHSCESCGAPLPETDSLNCIYCGKQIEAKNKDWMLHSIEPGLVG